MNELPFKEGTVISLIEQYLIKDFKLKENYFWAFDAIQLSTNKKVLVRVYTNEHSLVDLEEIWKTEVEILKQRSEISEWEDEFIEAGVFITEDGIKNYIIILSFIEDVEHGEIQQDEKDILKEITSPSPAYSPKFEKSIYDGVEEIRPPKQFTKEEEFEEIIQGEEKRDFEEDIITDSIDEQIQPSATAVKTHPSSTIKPKEQFKKQSKVFPSIKSEMIYSEIEPVSEEEISSTVSGEKDFLKNISMVYFDRMNPRNYYPITLNISDILQETIAPVINPITGERKVQKQTEIKVKLENPIVKVQPIIPGCSVVPNEIETDFSLKEDTLTFYISPGVKGKILGHINFISESKIIHSTDFFAKVIDPNYARVVALYGLLASFIPKIITFLGINIGLERTLNSIWTSVAAAFGNIDIASLIAILAFIPIVLISIIVRVSLKPRSKRVQFKITDFRLKDLLT